MSYSNNAVYFCVVKYVNPITKLCIIRASREEYQKVWSAITMVRSIGNCPVLFNLLDLSGEFNSCHNYLMDNPCCHDPSMFIEYINFCLYKLYMFTFKTEKCSESLTFDLTLWNTYKCIRIVFYHSSMFLIVVLQLLSDLFAKSEAHSFLFLVF